MFLTALLSSFLLLFLFCLSLLSSFSIKYVEGEQKANMSSIWYTYSDTGGVNKCSKSPWPPGISVCSQLMFSSVFSESLHIWVHTEYYILTLYRHVDNIYSMFGDWIVYIIMERYAFCFDHAAVVCGISSLIRGQTWAPAVEAQSPSNQWTTKGSPQCVFPPNST